MLKRNNEPAPQPERVSLHDITDYTISTLAAENLPPSLLSPDGLYTKALQIRAQNGGQRAVNNLLENCYTTLKEIGPNLSAAMAAEYAKAFENLGAGQYSAHAVKILAMGESIEKNQNITKKALNWITSDDTGASSKSLWFHLMDRSEFQEHNYPHDMYDFGRCVRLMDAIPEWRSRIPEIGEISERWRAISLNWDRLEAAYRQGDIKAGSDLLRDVMGSHLDPRTSIFSPEAYERRQAIAGILSAENVESSKDESDPRYHYVIKQLPLSQAADLANDLADALRGSDINGFSVMVSNRSFVTTAGARPFGEAIAPQEEANKGYFNKVSPGDFNASRDVKITVNFSKGTEKAVNEFVAALTEA